MKINIGNDNKIKNSNIGTNNKMKKDENKGEKIFIEILIGIFVTVVGGIILFFITK